jgi:hypothetical protein
VTVYVVLERQGPAVHLVGVYSDETIGQQAADSCAGAGEMIPCDVLDEAP